MEQLKAWNIWFFVLFFSVSTWAKSVEVKDEAATQLPVKSEESAPTGKEEATKYFTKPDRAPASQASPSSTSSREHFLGLHFGGFIDSDTYMWGRQDKSEDVGKMTAGVTYRMGEWVNAADLLLRADFETFEVDEFKPLKMSIIFAATFPDATSHFPLYFGAGVGPGIFFKQARVESPLSLDYQLLAGMRFFDVFEGVGFFAEGGLKNHLHLLSDGQFNGTFIAVGALFTF